MEIIKNKYGKIVYNREYQDLTIETYDANGELPKDRRSARELQQKILKENRRLAREELIDLLCNRYEDINYDVIEGLLYRIGYLPCDKNKVSNFYEIFEDLAYSFKSDAECDEEC